jgi:hypothetical protein
VALRQHTPRGAIERFHVVAPRLPFNAGSAGLCRGVSGSVARGSGHGASRALCAENRCLAAAVEAASTGRVPGLVPGTRLGAEALALAEAWSRLGSELGLLWREGEEEGEEEG